jgi:hypothetical protein
MADGPPVDWFWGRCALGIIALGLLSRSVVTGVLVLDKYAGDALYAAMVYAWLRMVCTARWATGGAVAVMLALELFQLTGIPAQMLGSENWATRMGARLLGVQFGYLDLLAYGVGIGLIHALARRAGSRR